MSIHSGVDQTLLQWMSKATSWALKRFWKKSLKHWEVIAKTEDGRWTLMFSLEESCCTPKIEQCIRNWTTENPCQKSTLCLQLIKFQIPLALVFGTFHSTFPVYLKKPLDRCWIPLNAPRMTDLNNGSLEGDEILYAYNNVSCPLFTAVVLRYNVFDV